MPTSRRSLLSATVAMIAAAPLDVATADQEPDPIHTLIEAHRSAFKAWYAAIDELAVAEFGPDPQAAQKAHEAEASTCDAEANVVHEIAITPPTTLAGGLAVLEYVTSFYEGTNPAFPGTRHDCFPDGEDMVAFIDSLRCTIAAHLAREG